MRLHNRSVSTLLLIAATALVPMLASAGTLSYGGNIAVDGDAGEWNLGDDYFAPMHWMGNPSSHHKADLYLRYDCDEQMLYALVLDIAGNGVYPSANAEEAWLKLYDQGLADDLLVDGNEAGAFSPRSFEWVYDGQELAGFEAATALALSGPLSIEASIAYLGSFASTGSASFNVDTFNDEIDALGTPETRVRVTYAQNGDPSLFPSTEVDLDGDGNADFDLVGWCVDTDHTIHQNQWYCADIFSSYAYPDGLDDTVSDNLDVVNWILNQDVIGQPSGGFGPYTYGDVQMAIWSLVEDAFSNNGLGPWDMNRVQNILTIAGLAVPFDEPSVDYFPPCGGVAGVILKPVNCDNGNDHQILIAQMLVSEFPVVCENSGIELVIACDGGVVESEQLPTGFALSPAHPNPFNPATQLTVSLAHTGQASLKVYNMQGSAVATLFEGMLEAGSHELSFSGETLPSGVYFAVLQSAGLSQTQKLMLVK